MSTPSSDLCDRFNLSFPLFQAGMGGIAGPELVAAVANTGCAGVLGFYKHPPERIGAVLREVEALTAAAYGVNFVPEIESLSALKAQVEAVNNSARRGAYFTFFGLPPPSICYALKEAGRAFIVQIGTLADASTALAHGADALIVQGVEGGGHLLGISPKSELIAEIVACHPGVPLIAAGGLSDGAGLVAAERIGAAACWCGTIFVPTVESRAHSYFKQQIVAANADATVVTDVFKVGWPGRPHRVIRSEVVEHASRFRSEFIAHTTVYGRRCPIPRFSAAVPTVETVGRVEHMALYAGISCGTVTAIRRAADVIADFREQYRLAIKVNDSASLLTTNQEQDAVLEGCVETVRF